MELIPEKDTIKAIDIWEHLPRVLGIVKSINELCFRPTNNLANSYKLVLEFFAIQPILLSEEKINSLYPSPLRSKCEQHYLQMK